MKTKSPTQLSVKFLKSKCGFKRVAIVEKWNKFAGVRQDMFGFGDLVAIKPGIILCVQTTTRSNMAARIIKIKSLPAHTDWLEAGGKIHVHGWAKMGARGKRKVYVIKQLNINKQGVCPVRPL